MKQRTALLTALLTAALLSNTAYGSAPTDYPPEDINTLNTKMARSLEHQIEKDLELTLYSQQRQIRENLPQGGIPTTCAIIDREPHSEQEDGFLNRVAGALDDLWQYLTETDNTAR